MRLIPILYHNLNYPSLVIRPTIEEIAGHFDIQKIKSKLYNVPQDYKFSLHTEYSAGARKLNSPIINKYKEIISNYDITSKGKIPKLWVSKKWAEEFALFIIDILDGAKPKIIEIHPPTTREMSCCEFLDYYEIFKKTLQNNGLIIDSENTIILLENRNGWGSKNFLLTYFYDFQNLSCVIDYRNSDLGLILDLPQYLNIHKAKYSLKTLSQYLDKINSFKHNIKAIHLWGQYNKNSHRGDMLDFFNNNQQLTDTFYQEIYNIFKDYDLYFVPEINLNVDENKTKHQCLANIINNLRKVGFII